MPPPPKSSLNKWKVLPEAISGALFNPLVVVTIMTTLTLILGVLAIVSNPPSKKIVVLCFVIAGFGLIAIYYEIRRLVRLDMAKLIISRLLAEGEQLTLYIVITSDNARRYPGESPADTVDDNEYYSLMADWCSRTDTVLRKYLDEAYVTRFHLGGSLQQDKRSMTIWKARHRLETLASFLTELR